MSYSTSSKRMKSLRLGTQDSFKEVVRRRLVSTGKGLMVSLLSLEAQIL